MKRGLLLLVIFLLTIASVSALGITYENVQSEALPGGSVSYLFHFTNNEDSTLNLKFKSPDLNWLLDQEENELIIVPGDSKDYKISFHPLSGERIIPGNYAMRLIIATKLTSIERLLNAKVLRYDEVLDANFVSGKTIDPRRGTILKLNVKNTRQVSLNNLNLDLSSDHYKFTKTFSLGRGEETTFEFPVKLDPDTLMGDYTAKAKVMLGNNLMLDKSLAYSIQEYKELKELSVPETGFLLSGETITYSNSGNTPVAQTVARTFGWFSYKFSTFKTKPTSIDKTDEGYLVKWDLNVQPQSNVIVSYVVNYRLPIAILVLLIVAIFVWYMVRQRNAIAVVKRVFTMHSETGSVRVMKVVINIRNRGSITINNVRLIDRVPSIIKAPTQHGALRPSHVKTAPDGTVMFWDLASLRPGEEKVISYRIEGKIQMLGHLVLPPSAAKYVLFGRGVTARSSSVSLHEKK